MRKYHTASPLPSMTRRPTLRLGRFNDPWGKASDNNRADMAEERQVLPPRILSREQWTRTGAGNRAFQAREQYRAIIAVIIDVR
ncbi:hypothetical protein J6590_043575 [Homalodisca vitripennis]|nr:hypothetical protein J6590_043575 [Homalodisca vitripennis]